MYYIPYKGVSNYIYMNYSAGIRCENVKSRKQIVSCNTVYEKRFGTRQVILINIQVRLVSKDLFKRRDN